MNVFNGKWAQNRNLQAMKIRLDNLDEVKRRRLYRAL